MIKTEYNYERITQTFFFKLKYYTRNDKILSFFSMNLTFVLRVYQHQLHLSKMDKPEAWTQQRDIEKRLMEENHEQLLSTELMRNISERLLTHMLSLLPKRLRNSTMMESWASKTYWASSKKKLIVQCEYHIWRYLVEWEKRCRE